MPELESMMKSLGYPSYSAAYWLVPNARNLEFGLKEIKKESDIIELRKSLMENDCVDFQIFFEHPVSEPIIAEVNETVNLDSDAGSLSSSHDSYESAEDEAYKPPPDEKARKSKKNKPRMTPASDIGHAEEVDLSQSAPTPEEPHAPSSARGASCTIFHSSS
ncbi:hypothetical protein PIB30_004323 [Stylosanthes scabra]|uniref:PB1-like domain-containing protein n=1 Tax=Stylosanthes scabra TaxID=79078 RepID=A0ABU6T3F6_9FABA|nr:hypothetical protein [Stylosanthes scabra]